MELIEFGDSYALVSNLVFSWKYQRSGRPGEESSGNSSGGSSREGGEATGGTS